MSPAVVKGNGGAYLFQVLSKKQREGAKFDAKQQAQQVQQQAQQMVGRMAMNELYLKAKRPIPEDDFYENYTQLENGVGMARSMLTDAEKALRRMKKDGAGTHYVFATGALTAPLLKKVLSMVNEQFPGHKNDVVAIRNDFFGPLITVSGLVTAGDLISQLKGKDLGECLYIPNSMLRSGEDVFLDDIHLSEVSKTLGVPVIPTDCEGSSLVKALLGRRKGKLRGYVPYELKKA
jgi:NifB/MoaA-like Fe-S oxidoreductase